MVFLRWILLFCLFCFSCGCGRYPERGTLVQMRQVQSKRFFGHTKDALLQSVILFLQDYGYSIVCLDAKSGVIVGDFYHAPTRWGDRFWGWFGTQRFWNQYQRLELTAHILEEPGIATVRISLCEKHFNHHGMLVYSCPVTDPCVYGELFERLEESLTWIF